MLRSYSPRIRIVRTNVNKIFIFNSGNDHIGIVQHLCNAIDQQVDSSESFYLTDDYLIF